MGTAAPCPYGGVSPGAPSALGCRHTHRFHHSQGHAAGVPISAPYPPPHRGCDVISVETTVV